MVKSDNNKQNASTFVVNYLRLLTNFVDKIFTVDMYHSVLSSSASIFNLNIYSIKISELTWFKLAYIIQDKFYRLLHEKRTNLTKLITGKTQYRHIRYLSIAQDLMNIKSKNEFFNHSTNQARKI